MITIIGLDNLEQWVYSRNCVFWKLFDTDNPKTRKSIASNMDQDNPDIEACIRTLRATILLYAENGLTGYLWVVDKLNNPNGGFYTFFRIPGLQNNNPVNGIGSVPVGFIQETEVEKRVSDAMEKFHAKLEKERLERENSELKAKVKELEVTPSKLDEAITGIANAIKPYTPYLLKGIFGINPPSVGNAKTKQNTSNNTTTENKQDLSEDELHEKDLKIMHGLEKLANRYDNLDEIIEKLGNMSETDPDALDGAIGILNEM